MLTDAEIARTLRKISPAEADAAILKLALEHQLVTRLTSLVAVDQTPSRASGEPLKLSELPINLPAGWDFAKIFGERQRPMPSPELPQLQPGERRADADRRVQVAALKPAGAAPMPMPGTITLPKTATDAELKMIGGSMLLALGLVLLAFNRRRRLVC